MKIFSPSNFRVIAITCLLPLTILACSKVGEPPRPKTGDVGAGPSTSAPNDVATKEPKLPPVVVPKGAETSSPAPGQAGDHSSPDFKGGGKPETHK